MTIIHNFISGVGPFFLLLGLLIFVHELGHFLVAKLFGVRVETFSLGFGKKILKFVWGETTYAVSWIPLGGYVKMFGDDPSMDIPPEERPRAFLHKPVWQRIAVVLAGPLMNLFFALVIFIAVAGMGDEMPGPYVGDVAANSQAYSAGFRSGDHILSINGEATPTWIDIKSIIKDHGGKAMEFQVERKGEAEPLKFEASAQMGPNDNLFSPRSSVGQIPGLTAESRSTVVGIPKPDSPAAKAGLHTMDVITAVAGKKITYWRDLRPTLFQALTPQTKSLQLTVRKVDADDKPENERTVNVEIPAGWDEKTDLTDWIGVEPAELYIYQIAKASPAEAAGIQAGDKVIRINNEDVHQWSDVLQDVKSYTPKNPAISVTILRSGAEKTFEIKPHLTQIMTPKGQEEQRFTIGIVSGFFPVGPEPVFFRITNPVKMFTHGLSETYEGTMMVVMSIVRLVQGEVSAKNLGGVITIGRVASHSFAAGLSTFLRTMAIISINLFLLNLLPIPILDGGHLLFYSIEVLQGAPLSLRKMELAQQIGLMLLMVLMVFALYNDISNLFTSHW